MKINKIKEITILSNHFKIVWNKNHSGGSFTFSTGTIEIGIGHIKSDPLYTLQIISHELMELILSMMGGRYENPRIGNKYLFNFDHQTFENAIELHTQMLTQFIKTK
jgi:hypothetical protein